MKELKITEKRENCRIRGYIPHTDTKQETFTGKETYSLLELNFKSFKTACLEIKKDDENFEEFDTSIMFIRVFFYFYYFLFYD